MDAQKTYVLWLNRNTEEQAFSSRGARARQVAGRLSAELRAVLANTDLPTRTHIEDCQSNSDVPGKGRFAVRGGVLRKKGRQSNNGTANATDQANVHQTGVETAMA